MKNCLKILQEIISDCSIKDLDVQHFVHKLTSEERKKILKDFKVSAAFERFEVVSNSGTMREVNHAKEAYSPPRELSFHLN